MSLTKATYSMIQGASFNVLDYGADSTGLTASTQAFQNAINAAATNSGSVYVPAGTYVLAAVNLKSNVMVYGQGWSSILKLASNSKNTCILQTDNLSLVQNVIISNLQFDGNLIGTYPGGVNTDSNNAHAIDLENVQNVIVENCYIHDTIDDGVQVYQGYDVIIQNNLMKTIGRNGVSATWGARINVSNNIIEGFNTVGIDIEQEQNILRDVVVTGNYIEPNYTRVNTFNSNRLYGISVNNASATFNDQNYCNVVVANNTIKGKLCDDAAYHPNAGIYAYYFRNLSITGNTVTSCVDGISSQGSTTVPSGISITANTVEYCQGIGVKLNCGDVANGNTAYNNGCGFWVYRSYCTLSGNFALNNGQYSYTNPYGIYIDGSTNSIFSNNICTDTQVSKTQTYGVYCKPAGGQDYNIYTGNNFKGNAIGSTSLVGSNNVVANNIT